MTTQGRPRMLVPTTNPVGDWAHQAACRNLPSINDFFPPEQVNGQPSGRAFTTIRDAGYRRAIAICNTCPVQADCLQWANDNGHYKEIAGVLGGQTPQQRRQHFGLKEKRHR